MTTSNSGQPYSQERCYVFKDLTYSACNREKPHVLSVVAFSSSLMSLRINLPSVVKSFTSSSP